MSIANTKRPNKIIKILHITKYQYECNNEDFVCLVSIIYTAAGEAAGEAAARHSLRGQDKGEAELRRRPHYSDPPTGEEQGGLEWIFWPDDFLHERERLVPPIAHPCSSSKRQHKGRHCNFCKWQETFYICDLVTVYVTLSKSSWPRHSLPDLVTVFVTMSQTFWPCHSHCDLVTGVVTCWW